MILSDNETRLDLLNNQAIAKTIASIVLKTDESVTIGVHGSWGAGKVACASACWPIFTSCTSITRPSSVDVTERATPLPYICAALA